MPVTNYGKMGYVGWVRFGNSYFIRATSADIKAEQKVSTQDVVDGKIDKTVYKLDPIQVSGSVAFPAVYEIYPGTTKSPAALLWDWALLRTSSGTMINNNQSVFVKYVDGLAFEYTQCVIDQYEFNITQGDVLNITTQVIGKDRFNAGAVANDLTLPSYGLRNTRAVTWNDVTVKLGGDGVDVQSYEIRQFSATVANNVQRIYTLNGTLAPQLILPTKRDINGSFELMGRNDSLGARAYSAGGGNQSRCTGNNTVSFGYSTAATGCGTSWFVSFAECVVFEIEEISITNELFVSKVNWHALPGIRFGNNTPETTNFVVSSI